jgi:hypothetical protein
VYFDIKIRGTDDFKITDLVYTRLEPRSSGALHSVTQISSPSQRKPEIRRVTVYRETNHAYVKTLSNQRNKPGLKTQKGISFLLNGI